MKIFEPLIILMVFYIMGCALIEVWEPRKKWCYWMGVFSGVSSVLVVVGGV